MKLFAPTNSWDIREPGSWWGLAGGATTAGVRVDQKTAKRFAAVFTAIRVISETLASLPCNLKEQVDSRTTRNATDHVLYPLFHDQPNPEQDIMSWLDSQVAFQVGWGNAFAEKQRSTLNQPAAFWQIHPSRIPIKNIRRNSANPDDFDYITAGQPGELVYYVNNDDGTQTPIAASDMFHVPGVMTENGVTGQSLIEWGASIKQLLLMTLLINSFLPFGLHAEWSLGGLLISLVYLLLKLLVLAASIVLVETTNAKMRFFRVPDLLAMAFTLAALGLVSTFLF